MNRNSSSESSDGDDRRGKKRIKSDSRSQDEDESLVIKLRGLPWSSTVDNILDFFKGIKVQGGREGVHLVTTPEGRSSGEAFVEVVESDMQDAIKKDKKNIGHRYIEVFKVKRAEMDWVLKRNRPNHSNSSSFRNNNFDDNECYIRMRGLPFECSKEDVLQFFGGLDVVSNGIQLMFDSMGRSSGEAYVHFKSKEIAEKALLRDRQCIGHRYIEIFRVGAAELRNLDSMATRNNRPTFSNRPGPYDRMRGNNNGNNYSQSAPMNRYGSNNVQRPGRYFGGKDSWNSYANEVGSWNRVNNPPPPQPVSGGRRHGHHSNSNAHCLLMRGLPYKANEGDIRRFFDPLVPMGVHIIYDSNGRPSGTAKVQFACGDDMTRAMGKHKEKIFTRYIELFVSSN
ncbi:unnamed protein product [Allacma fusca]|uniref:RRM domain-containing protein n=1 Tax=Allacma fusca TaxID=39272 RepID=A0A8J2JSH4_9HEXA|nr:unnamed protein product [Allacma fusca]